MKNFLELLGTEIDLLLSLTIKAVSNPTPPKCKIFVNNQCYFDNILEDMFAIKQNLSLNDPIRISIELENKQYIENQETAIVVQELNIGGVSMIPNYVGQAMYTNDHNYSDATTYLGFNGIWELNIEPNFYMWLHRVDGKGQLLDKYSIKE